MALVIEKNFTASNVAVLDQEVYKKTSNQFKLITALCDLLGKDLEGIEISKFKDSYYLNAAQCQAVYNMCLPEEAEEEGE